MTTYWAAFAAKKIYTYIKVYTGEFTRTSTMSNANSIEYEVIPCFLISHNIIYIYYSMCETARRRNDVLTNLGVRDGVVQQADAPHHLPSLGHLLTVIIISIIVKVSLLKAPINGTL